MVSDEVKLGFFIGYEGINNQGERFVVESYALMPEKNSNKRSTKYLVRFYETGYRSYYRKQLILEGCIKDPYYPSILGVACVGLAPTREPGVKGSKPTREYNMWKHMIYRCYDPNTDMYYRYGGLGVTVCTRWLCFEYFLQDIVFLDNYQLWKDNPGLYQFDKDFKQQHIPLEQRIYSPETCMFVTALENSLESKQRWKYGEEGLPHGIHRNSAGNYEVSICSDFLGIFTNLEAALSERNDYIRHTAALPNTMIQPIENEMDRLERRKYKVNRPKKTMCRIKGDDHSEEFIERITKEMQKNGEEV